LGVAVGATQSILPGAVRQNGYIVRDLDHAIEQWIGAGMNDRIRDAAADWHGTDPIRPRF
jgi:hypothetical protein